MKLKQEQIAKLTRIIYNHLTQQNLIKIRSSEKDVLEIIEGILLADARIEDEIEREAKKTMEKFRSQIESGEIDYQKMYAMVKKQLIKDKKFII